MKALQVLSAAIALTLAAANVGQGGTVNFFDPSQIATLVSSGVTSDTISSNGYLFTYTRDKLFTGGIGMTDPIGRPVRVNWPTGIEAQAVTTGPNPSGARITISRQAGGVFDLPAFTAKLLANTAATGASIEIMPSLNGEDAFNDPLYFDASGYYGSTFSYDTSPNYWGSTARLTGYDKYTIGLFVDYALIALSLHTITPPFPGDTNGDLIVDFTDLNTLLTNYGLAGAFAEGDFDGNGIVNFNDLNMLLTNYGLTAPQSAQISAVPEPASWVLAALGGVIALLGCLKQLQPRAA